MQCSVNYVNKTPLWSQNIVAVCFCCSTHLLNFTSLCGEYTHTLFLYIHSLDCCFVLTICYCTHDLCLISFLSRKSSTLWWLQEILRFYQFDETCGCQWEFLVPMWTILAIAMLHGYSVIESRLEILGKSADSLEIGQSSLDIGKPVDSPVQNVLCYYRFPFFDCSNLCFSITFGCHLVAS